MNFIDNPTIARMINEIKDNQHHDDVHHYATLFYEHKQCFEKDPYSAQLRTR